MCQNPNTKIRIEFWGFGLELTNSQYHWYSLLVPNRNWNGASPSGKATGFGPGIRRFESFRPRPGRIKIFNSRLRNPLKYILIKYTCTSFFFFFFSNKKKLFSQPDLFSQIESNSNNTKMELNAFVVPASGEHRSQEFESKNVGWAFLRMPPSSSFIHFHI